MVMGHNRIIDEGDVEIMARGGLLGVGLPKMEIVVRTKRIAILDIESQRLDSLVHEELMARPGSRPWVLP